MECKRPYRMLLVLSTVLLLLLTINNKRQHRLPNLEPIPQPTSYPRSFTIQFDTNLTRRSQSNSTERPLRSTLYYDWEVPAQRVDHPAGAYECIRFYNVTRHGCSLYFLASGMYRVIARDASYHGTFHPCCLDIPSLGPPPPDWARRANPTFHGFVHDVHSGSDAYEFVFDHVVRDDGDVYDKYHTSREVHDGTDTNGIPLVFTFPGKAKGLQDYHFDPSSLVLGQPDRMLFQLPEGCQNVKCEERRTQKRATPGSIKDLMTPLSQDAR